LPDVLSWLQDVVIELWIDQEGFRAIRPQFVITNLSQSAQESWSDPIRILTSSTVEFRPRKRESSVFHYGVLDTPPGLRRLTMAGDESKDYISRQASLSVKSNGVYVVCGSEQPASGLPGQHGSHLFHPHEQRKLTWRFEYLVDDRRAEATGKPIPGEKTFMALTFSCSPGLLHPDHGKKIRLIQVFKKSMSPKILSEKM
ncbi:hypothetical protein OBBRIDRAFT_692909, partial [Obba rivulosa]